MIAASSPTEGSDPSSSPISAAVSESPSGASAIVWAPCTRVSAPSYSGREVISTIDGVRGMTVRKSASIDSLTASIQCASSMMNSAGSVRASDAVLISAVNRRRRASGSIAGSGTSGSAMPSRSSSSSRSCGSASGNLLPHPGAGGFAVEVSHAGARPQQPRHHMRTGMSRACDSQKAQNTSTPRPAASAAASRATRDLPMPGGPTTFTTPPRPPIARSTMASRAAISQRRPTRLASARPTRPSRGLDRQQPARAHRFVGPLDAHPLRFAQHHGVLDQPRGRLRQHHRARRRHRFHPLRQSRPARRSRRNPTTPNRSHRRSPDPNSGPPAPAAPHHRGAATSAANRFASSWMASAARHARKA